MNSLGGSDMQQTITHSVVMYSLSIMDIWEKTTSQLQENSVP